MAPNRNRPRFNNSWRHAANADASYQIAPLMSYNSLQPWCNVGALIDDYESRISTLDQEIYHLNGEQQKFFSLKAKCAKLRDQLLEKDAELEALKQSKEKVCKIEVDHKDLLHEVKRYKDKFERAQKENEILMKTRLSEDSCKNLSLQILELRQNNKKLREENEVLKENRKDSDASKSRVDILQTELNRRTGELQKCNERLEKAEEENNRVKDENGKLNNDMDDFEDIIQQNAKEILRLRNSGGDIDQLKSELNTCRAQLESCSIDKQKAREDKSGIVAERDRLKADLAIANETIEISVERSAKLSLKLKIQEDKCKVYIAEMDKLKQNLAQSENLKNELDHAKTANERLSGVNKELEKEAKRLWNKIYVSSNDGQGSSKGKNEDGKPGPTAPKKKKANNPK